MKPYRDHIRTMLFVLLVWVAFVYARQGCPSAQEIAEGVRNATADPSVTMASTSPNR